LEAWSSPLMGSRQCLANECARELDLSQDELGDRQ
jgi:hypothetical protein